VQFTCASYFYLYLRTRTCNDVPDISDAYHFASHGCCGLFGTCVWDILCRVSVVSQVWPVCLRLLEWVLTKRRRLSLFDFLSVANQPLTSVIGYYYLTTRDARSWVGREGVWVGLLLFLHVIFSWCTNICCCIVFSYKLPAKFRLTGLGTVIHYTLLMF